MKECTEEKTDLLRPETTIHNKSASSFDNGAEQVQQSSLAEVSSDIGNQNGQELGDGPQGNIRKFADEGSILRSDLDSMAAFVHPTTEPGSSKAPDLDCTTEVTNSQDLIEQSLRQLIRDEISAAIEYNDEKVETLYQERHELAMRTRLSQFGFQENQIQAVLHPPSLHSSLGVAPQPTYSKIRKQYLDVETLHHYNIPYADDVDPNYLLLLQELTRLETDMLFEHTRELRLKHSGSAFKEKPQRRTLRQLVHRSFGKPRESEPIYRVMRREHIAAKVIDPTRPRPTILENGTWSDRNNRLSDSDNRQSMYRHLTPESSTLVLLNYLTFCPIEPGLHILHTYQDHLRRLVRKLNRNTAALGYNN